MTGGVLTNVTDSAEGTEGKGGSIEWRSKFLFGGVYVCVLSCVAKRKGKKAIRRKYCVPSPLLHMKIIQSLRPIEYRKRTSNLTISPESPHRDARSCQRCASTL